MEVAQSKEQLERRSLVNAIGRPFPHCYELHPGRLEVLPPTNPPVFCEKRLLHARELPGRELCRNQHRPATQFFVSVPG